MSRIFLDTNFLVYSHDTGVPAKRNRAMSLLEDFRQASETAVISTQVLQELYSTLTKKLHDSPAEAKDKMLRLAGTETIIVTPAIILAAADLHASASLSFWDALIIAAAQSADCEELWTEDLQDGQRFGKLKVVNPFKGLPAA